MLDQNSYEHVTFLICCFRFRWIWSFKKTLKYYKPNNEGKKRWFLLNGKNLYYYDTEKDAMPNGVIDLTQVKSIEEVDSDGPTTFRINVPQRIYYLRAPDENDLTDWLACLNETTVIFFAT